jgi:ATP adenylyltransferase
MDRIWSPWRSRYLARTTAEEGGEEASIFRRIAAEDRDEENLVVWRGELVYIAMNLYPYNRGHLLIIPYRQVERYGELTADEQKAMMRAVGRAMDGLDAALDPDGFHTGMNLGKAAGAGIPGHLHIHVVPRWKGDADHIPADKEPADMDAVMRETYRRLREVL